MIRVRKWPKPECSDSDLNSPFDKTMKLELVTYFRVLGSLAVIAASSLASSVFAHSVVPTINIPSNTGNDRLTRTQSSGRAVVVIEGGGSTHAFTTPWAACDGDRPQYIQALLNAGFPVFTAPGFGNLSSSTDGKSGCPPQPPIEVQWNTAGFPTQAGQAVLGFLGYLHETYGYRSFDLVGYSYGGVIARATVAALKQKTPAGSMAPAFSYAQIAVDAGLSTPSIVTLNSPHLGAPLFDIAADPKKNVSPVIKSWGLQYANNAKALIWFERFGEAGAIQVLRTSGHAKPFKESWDERQVGVLDGVSVTLIAGDYCGRRCPISGRNKTKTYSPRTDGTVPVYSQLMLPCPTPCPVPPGSVYLPPGMIPEASVVRKTFPTIHSEYDANRLQLPPNLSVTNDPAAIDYLVSTFMARWKEAGISVITHHKAD